MKMRYLLFCVVYVLCASCANDTDFILQQSDVDLQSPMAKDGNLRIFIDHGPDFGCSGFGGSCFDDVIVDNSADGYVAFKSLIQSVATESAAGIALAVDRDYVALTERIDQVLLDGVIDGDISMTDAGKCGKGFHYIVFNSVSSGKQLAIVPLRIAGM